ncbi:unnamed protein product [Clavelina lepadiformis]|uniref:Uncharacterized protein n=1 Tax=Clavelina lepadiformis TaxID=159417 RepID=A0ABP0G0P9_CLALP
MTKMLTTPGIPRRSPIQVPTNRARGCLTSEIGSTQPGMVHDYNAYNTRYSQAVTHPSTNRARGCLTSEIERDRVYSTWYGRRRLQKRSPIQVLTGPEVASSEIERDRVYSTWYGRRRFQKKENGLLNLNSIA